MFNRRILISTAAVCALSAAVAGGAAAMPDSIDGPAPSAEVMLFHQRATLPTSVADIRGEAVLDREYEHAGYVRLPSGTTAPQWFDALYVRSDALNRIHGLGVYADLSH